MTESAAFVLRQFARPAYGSRLHRQRERTARAYCLEAGFEAEGRPMVLLLHGFPEIAYSWRKVMPALAQAGFHVVAPDQRGYGRTTGWDASYDGDLGSFRMLNLVRDHGACWPRWAGVGHGGGRA